MKNIFNLITIAIFLLLSFSQQSLFSQSPDSEIGVRINSFDNFAFIYKKKRKKHTYTRYRFGSANLSLQGNIDALNGGLAFGLAIGNEKRKKINEKFYFIRGIEPYTNFNISAFDGSRVRASIILGIGYVLGFQYNFSDEFYVNLETIPSISTNLVVSEDGLSDNFALGAGFNSNIAAISFVYRFKRPEKTKKKK